eukprot:1764721-Pleurochrysis_carterae.AAC.1
MSDPEVATEEVLDIIHDVSKEEEKRVMRKGVITVERLAMQFLSSDQFGIGATDVKIASSGCPHQDDQPVDADPVEAATDSLHEALDGQHHVVVGSITNPFDWPARGQVPLSEFTSQGYATWRSLHCFPSVEETLRRSDQKI